MVNSFTVYPRYCFNCASELIWQNDFSYEDVYQSDCSQGISSFFLCSNDECGLMVQSDISEDEGMERLIVFSMED